MTAAICVAICMAKANKTSWQHGGKLEVKKGVSGADHLGTLRAAFGGSARNVGRYELLQSVFAHGFRNGNDVRISMRSSSPPMALLCACGE